MTRAAIAYTELQDSAEAGARLGADLAAALGAEPPDAVILFASSRYDYEPLLRALDTACRPRTLVGCSSAGEFTSAAQGEGAACALALRAPEMRFTAAVGRGLRSDPTAARQLVAAFRGLAMQDYRYRSALVLTDALAGQADHFVQQLTLLTAGRYQFFGGGAGDDAQFRRTHVFCGTEAIPDAAVALEILSNKPLGIGGPAGLQPC